ncbi:hypothetical protein C8R43DRAFT_952640 [Mycena crocata]|nr:hypothetical protein C8R43DRAFT_952640 [Mycena crocata]
MVMRRRLHRIEAHPRVDPEPRIPPAVQFNPRESRQAGNKALLDFTDSADLESSVRDLPFDSRNETRMNARREQIAGTWETMVNERGVGGYIFRGRRDVDIFLYDSIYVPARTRFQAEQMLVESTRRLVLSENQIRMNAYGRDSFYACCIPIGTVLLGLERSARGDPQIDDSRQDDRSLFAIKSRNHGENNNLGPEEQRKEQKLDVDGEFQGTSRSSGRHREGPEFGENVKGGPKEEMLKKAIRARILHCRMDSQTSMRRKTDREGNGKELDELFVLALNLANSSHSRQKHLKKERKRGEAEAGLGVHAASSESIWKGRRRHWRGEAADVALDWQQKLREGYKFRVYGCGRMRLTEPTDGKASEK